MREGGTSGLKEDVGFEEEGFLRWWGWLLVRIRWTGRLG